MENNKCDIWLSMLAPKFLILTMNVEILYSKPMVLYISISFKSFTQWLTVNCVSNTFLTNLC